MGRATLLARWLLRIGLALVATALALEIGLRVARLARDDRLRPPELGRARILCIGDSHTYGVLVPLEASYPAHLQRRLDEAAPGRFSVINRGIPGMTAVQVRNRIEQNLERFRPHAVVAWVGVNDSWNHSEVDRAVGSERGMYQVGADALVRHSRLARFVRLVMHDRSLDRELAQRLARTRRDGRRQPYVASSRKGDVDSLWTLEQGDVRERVQTAAGEFRENEERVFRALRETAERVRLDGTPFFAVRYPLEIRGFRGANQAVDRLHAELGIPVVDAGAALARVPEKRVEWLEGAHPNGPVYDEVARDLAALILAGSGIDP